MDNAKIKEILLDIEPSELDFTVIMTGKDSKKGKRTLQAGHKGNPFTQ